MGGIEQGVFAMVQAGPKSVTKYVTAFMGEQRLASGSLADVALAIVKASKRADGEPIGPCSRTTDDVLSNSLPAGPAISATTSSSSRSAIARPVDRITASRYLFEHDLRANALRLLAKGKPAPTPLSRCGAGFFRI